MRRTCSRVKFYVWTDCLGEAAGQLGESSLMTSECSNALCPPSFIRYPPLIVFTIRRCLIRTVLQLFGEQLVKTKLHLHLKLKLKLQLNYPMA